MGTSTAASIWRRSAAAPQSASAERLYQQLDALQQLRRQAQHDLIVECRKHAAAKWL